MSFAEFLKFVHVVAAIVWVGGPVVVEVLGHRAVRRGGESVAQFGRDADLMGRIFGAAAFIVLGFGIWMVADRPHIAFGDTWVVVSLVLTSILTLMGPVFFGPQSQRLAAEATEKGGDHPDSQRRAGLILRVARLDTLTALFVVYLMVAKPWM